MRKGIFGITDNKNYPIISISTPCDENGISLEKNVHYSSKSGTNFNHQAEWSKLDRTITTGHSFHYYPRGRVEVRNRRITIFLHPDLNNPDTFSLISQVFELNGNHEHVRIKQDGSCHYRYDMAKL